MIIILAILLPTVVGASVLLSDHDFKAFVSVGKSGSDKPGRYWTLDDKDTTTITGCNSFGLDRGS